MRDLDPDALESEVGFDLHWRLGTRHHRDPRPFADLADAVPAVQLTNDVGADQQEELGSRIFLLELREGIDGVGGAGPFALTLVDLETFRAGRRRPDHPGAYSRRRLHPRSLQRMFTGGDEAHPIEAKRFRRVVRNDQVTDVRWVEGSTENAEPHPAASVSRHPCASSLTSLPRLGSGLQVPSLR